MLYIFFYTCSVKNEITRTSINKRHAAVLESIKFVDFVLQFQHELDTSLLYQDDSFLTETLFYCE